MYSFTSALVRKRIGRPIKPPIQSQSSAHPAPSVASAEVDELPNDIFTESVDITKSKKTFNNVSGNMCKFYSKNVYLCNSYHVGTKITTSGGTS